MKSIFWLLALTLAMDTMAAPSDDGPPEGRGFTAALLKDLNLTPEQKQKVAAIRKQHRERLRALREDVKQLRAELGVEFQNPKKGPDYRKQLTEKFAKFQAARKELVERRFQKALEIREILNDDQIKKLKGIHGAGPGKVEKSSESEP